MTDALQAGAAALQDLIGRIRDKGEADLVAANDDGRDTRDYCAMADLVRRDLSANLDHASPDHRQGYLRALTDLLSMVGDHTLPSIDWDPIRNTAAAYARPAEASHD